MRPPVSVLPFALIACVTLSARQRPSSTTERHDAARSAIQRAIPLMQRSAQTWIEKQTCSSCHHQALGTFAVLTARQRGVSIDGKLLDAQLEHMTFTKRDTVLQWNGGINPQIGQGYLLAALAAAGHPPRREVAEARAHFIAGRQDLDGHWRSESHRPPLEDSEFTATALSLRLLQLYAPPARGNEFRDRVARARTWLENATGRTTEERTMQLLGLAWAAGNRGRMQTLATTLIAQQRPDGGWTQIPGIPSDAYATGQTLVVLEQAGFLRIDDPAFRRGVDFLLSTQQPDGSWHQTTRRKGPGLPYFETGFPHGVDQFISFAGSAWATMALSLVLDSGPTPLMQTPDVRAAERRAAAEDPLDDGITPLMEAAISGTPADVERLLNEGADVNARSAGGITALMCAVHDPREAALLIQHGADINAKTQLGVTPLFLASAYSGAIDTVKLLLDRGANPKTARNDGAAPLHAAVSAGDAGKAALLLDRGAEMEATVTPPGFTPLHVAAVLGDASTVRMLLKRGAKANARIAGFGNTTAIIEASFAGFPDVVRALVDAGADINAYDDDRRTALMYAVWRDPGYTDVADVLLKAGADLAIKMPDGKSALALAQESGNTRFVELLRAAVARRAVRK